MRKKITLLLAGILVTLTSAFAQNSGTLKGKVTDRDNKQPLPFVNVIIFLNGNLVTGGQTDIDGEYTIKPVDPGTYDIQFNFVGYQSQELKGVPVSAGKIQFANAELSAGAELKTLEISDFKVPLIDKDGGASGGTVTREELARMPSRDALGLAQTVAGVSSAGTGGGISIRGARTGSTWVYIDGIKVRGSSSLPKSAIEEVSVITGGVPANIGDVTGGVINISLRSASANYTGGVEAITSGFKIGDNVYGLDKYGYNLLEGSLSGPLVFRKNPDGTKSKKPLLGFFVSGNYTDIVDGGPTFGGVYKMKDENLAALLENPLRQNVQADGTVNGALYNADFLGSDAFEKIDTRLNVRNRTANVVGKIDLTATQNTTFTVGGTAAYRRGNDFDYSNMLMNYANNQQATDWDWRAYAKFSQRFNNSQNETGTLKNVFYSIMVDYSSTYRLRQDATHGDKLFRYGHVGYFDLTRARSYSLANEGGYYEQNGWQDVNIAFTPSQYNPDLAAITNQFFTLFDTPSSVTEVLNGSDPYITNDGFFDPITNEFTTEASQIGDSPYSSLTNIQGNNGLINGQLPTDTYGLWNYVGGQSNNYSVSNNKQFRVSGTGSADIGDHAIQVGFEFEQRKDAGYSVAPVGLWLRARQLANFHIEEINENDPSYFSYQGVTYQNYGALVGSDQFEFDYNLREALGLDPNGSDFINVDGLNPDDLSIDMFGADDLLNQGNSVVSYYGYDPYGNKLSGRRPTINDFFSDKYSLDGKQFNTRRIGAFEPTYISGYIMDKFAFDDLIFNVGLRIDRYDANQYVPTDPYVISQAYTAGEVNFNQFNASRPSNIGDDFVVYVDNLDQPTAITGYRDGNNWYNASGTLVSDPFTSVASGGSVKPFLKVDPKADLTADAFKEYEPVVNFMPRIAFSFPISDEALFFAHYDVLTQRPTESNRFDPTDYLFLANASNPIINNPNLKPERTVDYALGFQQVLSKTSSLKVEAFYRELRNMIQIRSIVGAYPASYKTFDNIDFGTVKGLTLSYDLRPTGNLWMKSSYTLQFADGTGSTTQTQLALINAGLPNLRTVNPVNFDQRHRIVTTVDYHYGSGSDYNGPVWFDRQVFANAGVNFIANLGSGTPYTPQVIATPITGEVSPTTEGSINGARLPWQFNVDMNIDKNITLEFGTADGKKKAANLNVYLWVNNLFNTQNITSVYRFTGTPDDDGYLAAAQYQTQINSQNSPSAYRNYYGMYVNNPYNLGSPRQIRLGVRLDF